MSDLMAVPFGGLGMLLSWRCDAIGGRLVILGILFIFKLSQLLMCLGSVTGEIDPVDIVGQVPGPRGRDATPTSGTRR